MKNIYLTLLLIILVSACKTTKNNTGNNKTTKTVEEQVPNKPSSPKPPKPSKPSKKVTYQYENALKQLSWLGDLKKQFDNSMSMSKKRITQYNLKEQTVFLIESCYRCPDATSTVYDKDKNVLCEFGGITGKNTCPDFDKMAEGGEIIYQK